MTRLLAALDLGSLPDISLGTAALLIFGSIASLAVLRGLLRILWGTLVLAVSGLVGFTAWQHAPTLSQSLPGREMPGLSWILSTVAFLVTVFVLRRIAGAIFAPPRDPDAEDEVRRPSAIRWAVVLVLSLIPTALLCFGGASVLRHAGSIAEIRAFAQPGDAPEDNVFLARLKQSIEQAIPPDWLDRVDPFAAKARLNLAKLISSGDSPPAKAIPVLEETEIRHIVLDDPELRALARAGRYSEILRDPRLDRILENDNLREVLANADL